MIIINKIVASRQILFKSGSFFADKKQTYNINIEEHSQYLRKVQKAKQDLKQLEERSSVPRRQRRVYDKPKYQTDLTNYAAWRIYDEREMLYKFWAHGAPVAAKLYLQPKWVIHAFGIGLHPRNHEKSASLQFSFEDNNFSKFLLYEYRNTTLFKPNVEGYDYDDQEHLHPRRRLIKRLSFDEFWSSEQKFEFRLNCSAYAQKFKFKRWVEETVENSKNKQSYDEFINKKYGNPITYNKKQDSKHYQFIKPAILNLTPQHYNLPKKGEKLKAPQVELPKRIGEEHRIMRKRTQTPKKEDQAHAEKSK